MSSFNRRDSKTIQKQVVDTSLGSALQASQAKEGDGWRPLLPWVSTSEVSPPCWQHSFKNSDLATEEGCGLWSLLSVNCHPELGSVAAERSSGLDVSVCKVPPVSKSCASPVHNLYIFLFLCSYIWYLSHLQLCHAVLSNMITLSQFNTSKIKSESILVCLKGILDSLDWDSK